MKTKQKLIAYFLSFALILGMISTVNVSAAKKISLSNKKITITKGSSKTIKVKNTKKKVKWKVLSGKKCITLKKKGKTAATVKGRKKGTAKIQALVEKKKLVCTVTVDDEIIPEQQNNPQNGITTNIPGGNANNQSPTTGGNEPEPTSEGDTPTKTPDNNTPIPDDNEPTQTPDAETTTETPHQEEIITLHYNDDNADEINKQIQGYSHYDDNDNLVIDKYVHVIVDDGITSIGYDAFWGCSSLMSIEIPQSVEYIKDGAFWDCSSLTSIAIPGSVTSIGDEAFVGCSSLTSIKVAENNQIYDSRNDCNAIIETETNTLIKGCKNTKIPKGITNIGDEAFSGCSSLTSIEIPDSVTSIGGGAFSGCSSLMSINIPEGITSIGNNAFSGCSSFTSIKVAENNQIYDSRNDCNAIIEIETNTLIRGCKNTKIPKGITNIGDEAFSGCSSLTSIEIPDSVTSIGSGAFSGCSSLTSIEIPESVTNIGDYTFEGCSSLTSIEIPESVTSIGGCAFNGCSSLMSIEIPESVTSIGYWAFYRCSSLTSINIPENVNYIDERAFAKCGSLTSIIWRGTTYNSADEFIKAFNAEYPN